MPNPNRRGVRINVKGIEWLDRLICTRERVRREGCGDLPALSPHRANGSRVEETSQRTDERSAAFKVVLDEGLDGLKMPVREVLESFFTGRDGFVGRAKGLDGFDQVIVILV